MQMKQNWRLTDKASPKCYNKSDKVKYGTRRLVLIDHKELCKVLFEVKESILQSIQKSSNVGQKELLGLQQQTIDKLLLLLHNMAAKGEMNMEKMKFLLIEEMEEATGRRVNIETDEFIKEIEAVHKILPVGKRVPLNPTSMSPVTFYNKVWALKKDGRIPDDLIPSKRGDKVYLTRVDRVAKAKQRMGN